MTNKEPVIVNAIIKSATITSGDHAILDAWIHLDYGGTGQGFGGYCLYTPSRRKDNGDCCGHFIWRVMEIAGVEKWEHLAGKTIRVKREDSWGSIISIGHIVKDDWFDPKIELSGNPSKQSMA